MDLARCKCFFIYFIPHIVPSLIESLDNFFKKNLSEKGLKKTQENEKHAENLIKEK